MNKRAHIEIAEILKKLQPNSHNSKPSIPQIQSDPISESQIVTQLRKSKKAMKFYN